MKINRKKYIAFVCSMALMFLLFPVKVFASNSIKKLDINVYINEDASADITETWNMYVSEGTEVYKPMSNSNMGASELSNFRVYENGTQFLDLGNFWNVNGTLSSKKYKSGINVTSNGFELCWGMGSYGNHTYTIKYHITNFVQNVEDGQIIYWKLVNDKMSPAPNEVSIVLESDIFFEKTVPVWGFGYKGYASVYEGKIYLDAEDGLKSSEYMVLLAEFEKDTFNAQSTLKGTMADYEKKALDGAKKQKVNKILAIIGTIIGTIFSLLPIILIIIISSSVSKNSTPVKGVKFGESGKKIDKKNLQYFRDIPCKKDIYRAYFVATLYGINKKKEDFIGTIFLKWIDEERISVVETPKKLFKKSSNSIDLRINDEKPFEIEKEKKLYDMLKEASKDGILENSEFERWCSSHYSKILNWFDDVLEEEKEKLTTEGYLTVEVSGKIFKTKKYVTQANLKEEAIQLAGLKYFLDDFSDMKNKEAIEVHLWKQYLMYAQIFGIAEKVAKQFKKLYPDMITDMSYDNIIYLNHISTSSMHQATSARTRAQSYSAGGGGGSFSGGGGGSFGGGSGGGCR